MTKQNDTPRTEQNVADDVRPRLRGESLLSPLLLLSGLLLLALLPVGIFSGCANETFRALSWSELGVRGLALVTSLCLLLRFAGESALPRWLTLGTMLATIGCIVIFAMLPATSRDALVHHLAVPKWWLEAGKIIPIPWHVWSFYPMLLQLGSIELLRVGAEWGVALSHGSFLPILAALSGLVARRVSTQRDAPVITALLTLTLPVAFRLAFMPMVDLALAAYVGLATYFVIRFVLDGGHSRYAVGCGMALGFALGAKYNAILAIAVFLPVVIVLFVRARIGFFRFFWFMTIVSSIALILYSPWLIRNLFWANNPVYPLAQKFLGGPVLAAGPGLRSIPPLLHRMEIYGESWRDIILIPLRMLFDGADADPRRFDGVLNPLLLFAVVPFISLRRQPAIGALGLFGIGYLLLALVLAAARVRYLAPVALPWLTLAGIGLAEFSIINQRRARIGVVVLLFGGFFLWEGRYLFRTWAEFKPISYLSGEVSRSEYLRAHQPEYALIEVANQTLGKDSLTELILTSNPYYEFEVPVISGGYHSAGRIIGFLREANDGESLLRQFRAQRITHLFVHGSRLTEVLRDALTPAQGEAWNRFSAEHLELIAAANGYSLWKIHDTSPQGTPDLSSNLN